MTPPIPGTASAPLARNDYREGQVLRARDLERESGYFLARDRQHAALAHIPGILRGLRLNVFERGTENAVTADDLATKGAMPLDLFLEAGMAVDGYGRVVSVPRREQLRTSLAISPSLLREGRYRVELLYDRAVEGGTAPGADPWAVECAAAAFTGGGGGTVRERFRLRLVENDAPLAVPGIGAVLDGPPDAPEAEAPVALGTVDWNGVDAFVGFSLLGRVYAGVRGEVLASPDERAELDLRDPGGRVAVRFAPQAEPGADPVFSDAVRIDEHGGVWVRSDLDVGPGGVRFRPDADGQVRSNWQVGLRGDENGASFGKRAPEDDGKEEDVGPPPEYAPGEQELRVVFERSDVPTGRRRVVVGHVRRDGGEASFSPSVIVYDRTPGAENEGASTVEVWGDLFIRGTAYLTGVQRVPRGKTPQGGGTDELDLLLRQLAGPLAGSFRAFLLNDPGWLDRLGDVLADRVPKDEGFVKAVADKLRGEDTFIVSLVSLVLQRVAASLATDDAFLTSLVDRLRMHRGLVEALAVEVRTHTTFITELAPLLAGSEVVITQLYTRLADTRAFLDRLAGTLAASESFIAAAVSRLKANAELAAGVATRLKADTDLATFVIGQITATPAGVTQAVVTQLAKTDPGAVKVKTELASTLALPILEQATPRSAMAQKLADIVVDEIRPGDEGFAQRLALSLIDRVNNDATIREGLKAALAKTQT